MILRTVLPARLFWNRMRDIRYIPMRAHSRSNAAENETQDSIEKATQLLGGDLAKLIHKVDSRHPLIDMARYHETNKLCG